MQVKLKADWNGHKKGEVVTVNGSVGNALIGDGTADHLTKEKKEAEPVKEKNDKAGPNAPKTK